VSGRLALVLAMAIWGLSAVANRSLVLQVGPRELFILRFTLAALSLLPLARQACSGPAVRRRDIGRIVVAALLNSLVYQLGVAYGVARVSASTTTLVLATEPVFIALISVVFLGDRPSARLYVGIATSLLGTVLLVDAQNAGAGGRTELVGVLLVLAAAIAFSVFSVIVKPLAGRYPVMKLTAWYTLIGTAALWPFAWLPTPIAWRLPDAAGWASALLLGVGCTVGCVLLWSYGLERVSAATAGTYLYLISPIGVAGSAVLLGERVTPMTLVAGALIVGGVLLGTWREAPTPRPAPAAGAR